jgi:hypothetical protein
MLKKLFSVAILIPLEAKEYPPPKTIPSKIEI